MPKGKYQPLYKRKAVRIEVNSIVAGRNLEPYIQIFVLYDDNTKEQVGQFTPAEALHHATAVLETIEAANTDAFLISFLTGRMEIPLEQTGPVLKDFREWRQRRLPPEETQ